MTDKTEIDLTEVGDYDAADVVEAEDEMVYEPEMDVEDPNEYGEDENGELYDDSC